MSLSFRRSCHAIFRRGTFLLLALAVGCGAKAKMTCKTNDDCGAGVSCVNGVCVPKLVGQTLGMEVNPSSDSPSARTEFPAVDLLGSPIEISADDNFTVQGMATFPTMTTPIYPSQEAHVSVTLPSRIPARAPLLVVTEMVQGQFTFNAPKTRLDTNVTTNLLFLPGTSVQFQPPVNLSAALTAMVNVTFPDPAAMTKIYGRFVTQSGAPLSSYLARASYQSSQISNIVPTMSMTNDGSFGLSIPPNAIPDADDSVSLTMVPIDSQDNLAQFVTTPVSLTMLAAITKDTPHVYVMPDLLAAQTFTTSVTTATGEPLGGVTAHFHGEVAAPPDGMATFDISAVSQTDGSVSVPLIPGTTDAPVLYEVSFRGPTDPLYKYASQCSQAVAVMVTDAGLPVPIPGAMLTPKFFLSGTVSDSMAAPAGGATVTATPAGTPSCAGVAPAAASAITDNNGYYMMPVDPGTYSLDVAPPAMAPWPRLTQTPPFTVSHATVYPISLPAGQAIEGHITTSDAVTSLPLANITVFQVFSDTTPPVAIAQTQTDMNGMFTTVLPPLQ